MDEPTRQNLVFQRANVLTVEDQFLMAAEMSDMISDLRDLLVGPLLDNQGQFKPLFRANVDLAILDIDHDGRKAHSVAAELGRRDIPFFFATGYEPWVVSSRFSTHRTLNSL